jgi:hypothetical protein
MGLKNPGPAPLIVPDISSRASVRIQRFGPENLIGGRIEE